MKDVLKKTVFILGAGASKPFGLPTGAELRKEILFLCEHHLSTLADNYGKSVTGFSEPEVFVEFARAFKRSGARSIDTFLEDNPKLQAVGKFLIAAVIYPAERRAIASDLICEDWMSWLLNSVRNASQLLQDGTLSFITFNYDRLLEAAIFQYYRYQRHEPEAVAWKRTTESKIIHVYGQLNDNIQSLLLQNDQRRTSDSPTAYIERALKASETIRIIAEHRDDIDSPVLGECKAIVQNADAVVCLGFGFDRTNVLRIGLNGIARERQVHSGGSAFRVKRVHSRASAFGMLRAEQDVAVRLLGSPDLVHLGQATHGCQEVLRDLCINFLSEWYSE